MPSPDLTNIPEGAALGMLETHGLVAAIEAADAMLKSADVRLLQQQRTNPALITHFVVGETAAVRAAVDAGRAAAERVGKVVSAHVIPRPGEGLLPRVIVPLVGGAAPSDEDYGAKTVRELRALARDRADDSFSGREIARATKAELVAYLSDGGTPGA
ncbi:MAG: BMC domain-containing protein [Bacteroidota bacterium]